MKGALLGWPWVLPFVSLLLSIATGPVLFPKIWNRHYGKIAAGWSALTIASIALVYGVPAALSSFMHAALADYLSFIVLLFALYTVAGGILITGKLQGTPSVNTGMLALGTIMGSVVGTTGASLILIRPLIRANASRATNAHVVVFFIILVANVGGALTPLGNPPLFAGFLRGVDFFWTAQNVWMQTGIVAALLLVIFYALDSWRYRREARPPADTASAPITVQGKINFVLIVLIVASILVSAAWKPGIAFDLYGTRVELQNLVARPST